MIKSIVVLGGGTAGWLTANLIAAKHVNKGSAFSITLIESPNIPTIGVGEGTWPTMVNTLQQLGISEVTFMQRCDASFKQASKFVNWVNNSDNDYYYHPFTPPQSFDQVSLVYPWQAAKNSTKFADFVSLQAGLCQHHQAPKQLKLGDFSTIENYGYHLDAGKFSTLLAEHGINQLGVNHVMDDVINVTTKENGDIASLTTQKHGEIAGDLFIDCSGQAAALIGKHYQIPFIDKKDILFIDKALAVQVPYPSPDAPVASATISTAQTAGWIWDIGLPTRRGVGHVFSSRHISIEQAKEQLYAYLRETVDNPEQYPVKSIEITPGYREKFWHRNCVAVGMASGFLEPLEASALVMVELAAKTIALHLPADRAVMDIVARQYNQNMQFRWQRIIDFLKLHYVLSQRDDSQFWRDNRDPYSIPESLSDLLKLWQYQAPSDNGFLSPYDLFPAASYQYILYGMGFVSKAHCLGNAEKEAQLASEALTTLAERKQKVPPLLPTNREILNEIKQLERKVILDISEINSGHWHYLSIEHIKEISQHFPIFFRKESQGFSPIVLTSLTDKTFQANCRAKQLSPNTSTSKPSVALAQDSIFEPVKLDITLNDETEIKVSGLYIIQQQASINQSLINKHSIPFDITLTFESLAHIPKLIEQENLLRAN